MKLKNYIFIASLLLNFTAYSQTNIPGGNVSGTWAQVSSPFIIDGDIVIQPSDSLVIEPGV